MKKYLIFLLLLVPAIIFAHRSFGSFKQAKSGWQASEQNPSAQTGERKPATRTEYEIGTKLAAAMMDRSAIFVATVIQVIRDPESSDGSDSTRVKVQLRIDEWIANTRTDWGPTIEAEQTINSARRRLSSEGRTAWDGIDVQPSERLLIALDPTQTGPRRYELVLSDQSMFQAVKQSVDWHTKHGQDAKSLFMVPETINDNGGGVFSSYFVSYLYRGGTFGDREAEALTLAELLAKGRVLPPTSNFLTLTLSKMMSGDFHPLSETAMRNLTEMLVSAAVADDLDRAHDALTVMLRVNDHRKLDLAPHLSPERRIKFIQNYRSLRKAGKIEKGHSELAPLT